MTRFECDVFVSYATANNQSLAEGKPGWVTSFRDVFKKNLDERRGRRNVSEVWMDYRLRGNEPFDEQLRGKVSSSAIMLVILSDAYWQSSWCQSELNLFWQATGGERGAAGRIFVVHYEPILSELWPSALRGLSSEKYRFFHQERDGATTIPLGYPIPLPDNPAHAAFYNRMCELIPDVVSKLNELTTRGDTRVVRNRETPSSHHPNSAVFLDEVTGDRLFDQRQRVKSHLEQCGLAVLPTKFYGRSSVAEIDEELSRSQLFVQMLGRFGGGYEMRHHARARENGIPVLRWRSRDLDIDAVDDPEHRQLLTGADVLALDFDELVRTILHRFRVLSAKREVPNSRERFVLVKATTADTPMAEEVAQQLDRWNVGYDLVDDTNSLRDLTESNAYDALLVIYGVCSHDWVRQQLVKCREIMLTNKSWAPACAVYIGPPPKNQPLRCRPPRVAVIDTKNEHQLRAFIDALPVREAPHE